MATGRRRRFAVGVVTRGLRWGARFFSGSFSAILTIAGLLGASVVLGTFLDPLVVFVIVAVAVAVAAAKGAYAMWAEQEDATIAAQTRAAEIEAHRDQLLTVPVPADHRTALQGLVAAVFQAVNGQTWFEFEKDRWDRSFAAHYPELRGHLDRWNGACRREESARAALKAALAVEAANRGIGEPEYYVDALVTSLATAVTKQAAAGKLSVPCKLTGWQTRGPNPQPHGEPEVIILCLGGDNPVAALLRDPETTQRDRYLQIVADVDQLFRDATGWPEAQEIVGAGEGRQALAPLIVDRLELDTRRETIYSSVDCEFCRVNLNHPDDRVSAYPTEPEAPAVTGPTSFAKPSRGGRR
jgi:hypothetical protein